MVIPANSLLGEKLHILVTDKEFTFNANDGKWKL
jgi:hypothetical protein